MSNKARTGTTVECVKHLRANALAELEMHSQKLYCKVRNEITDLLGVSHGAGHDWFDKFALPKGINLLKLQYFLELVGYTPTERLDLKELQRRLAQQLVFGLVRIKDLAAKVGSDESVVSRWASHGLTRDPARLRLLRELLDANQPEVIKLEEVWLNTVKDLHLDQTQPQATIQKTEVVASTKPIMSSSNDSRVVALAHLLLAAMPLADELLSDNVSPDQRDKLRELTRLPNSHYSAVFEMSHKLSRLCGERARKDIKP